MLSWPLNALAFQHFMKHKKSIIRKNDLIAGTTGSKEISTHVFGDGQGTLMLILKGILGSTPWFRIRCPSSDSENYRNLMVRISGYNAYFVQRNKDIQMELIHRSEYSH